MNKSGRRFVYSLGVLACALPLAINSSAISEGKAEGLFDYSNSLDVAYINSGDLLAKSGVQLDPSEVNYLNTFSAFQLSYSEAYRHGDVKTSIIGDDLLVFAKEKTYSDENGRSWTWVPKSVQGDENILFLPYKDLYVAEISGGASKENVNINYELSLDVSQQVFNSFIDKSYNDAVSFENLYNQYEDDLDYYNHMAKSQDEYDAQKAAYDAYKVAYQNYLVEKENYENYLLDKAKYDENLVRYNNYIVEKAKYDEDLKKYNQYQEDLNYYLQNKDELWKEWNEYGAKWVNSRYQMEAMHIPYEQDTVRNRSLASYILSGTVATVLARKSELSVLGVPSDLIDAADSSTKALRNVFSEYDKLLNNSERYSYYYLGWELIIKPNTNILLRSLERLIRYQSVRNNAKDRGKLDDFNTLIFQLIYFANAINDEPVYNYEAFNPVTEKGDMSRPGAAYLNEDYVIDGYTYKTWLKGIDFIDVNGVAKPTTGDWPTVEPKDKQPPAPPAEVPMPVEPVVVNKPTPPPVAVDPGEAPKEVLQPIPYDPDAIEPTIPSILLNPVNKALLDAKKAGKVVSKEKLTQPVEIIVDGQRNIVVSDYLSKVAVFHDYEYKPKDFIFFDTGVEYFEIPVHPEDTLHTEYYFDFWTDELGDDPQEVELGLLDESTRLYPVFDPGPDQIYEISWIYPDEEEPLVSKVPGGRMPTAPKTPVKEETEEHYYVFSGWSPSLVKADSNATYEATFTELDIFDVVYDIDGNEIYDRVKENYLPNPPNTLQLPNGTYYVIKGWEEEFVPTTEVVTYHAIFEKYYTITWQILDESYTERYLEGSEISYKGEIPDTIRHETMYEQFKFASDDFGKADSNKTIVGNYVNYSYPQVILEIDNISIDLSGQYLIGEEVDKPTTYNTDLYHYDISGWVETDHGYRAIYTKTPFISGDVTYKYVNEALQVDVVHSGEEEPSNVYTVDVGYLFSQIEANEISSSAMNINFGNGKVELSNTTVDSLVQNQAAEISFEFVNEGNNSYSFKLIVKNADNEEIDLSNIYAQVTINENIDYLHSQIYADGEEVNADISYGKVSLRAHPNQLYQIKPTYSVSIQASSAVSYNLSQESAQPGELISLQYSVAKGYELSQIIVRTKGGQNVEIDSQNRFQMPADDVVINFNCKKNRYTLNLYVDDVLYATYNVDYGSTVSLPTNIKKVGTESEEYLFKGWGIEGESLVVTENTDLHAEFVIVEKEKESQNEPSNAVKIAGYVAVGGLVGGLTIALFFIFRKISKH